MDNSKKLTTEQEQQLVQFQDECLKIGLTTGPSNRQETKRVITELYERLGKEKPEFVFVNSPLEACSYIRKNRLPYDLGNNLGNNLGDKIRDNLWSNLWDNLRDYLGNNLGNNLYANLRDTLWINLRDTLGSNLWDNFKTNIMDNLRTTSWDNKFHTPFWGSLDIYWISYYLFPHLYLSPMHTDEQMEQLNLWYSLSQSCFLWYPFEHVVIVSDRPTKIHKDSRTRLHNSTGPALSFSDGYSLWMYHGVTLPKKYIEDHSKITVKVIEECDNIEVRRSLIELYGVERYVKDSGAVIG